MFFLPLEAESMTLSFEVMETFKYISFSFIHTTILATIMPRLLNFPQMGLLNISEFLHLESNVNDQDRQSDTKRTMSLN